MDVGKKALYVNVYDDIYKNIQKGVYREGDKLPSETELTKTYNVSRSTIREALLILKENGVIYNVQGAGNYVARNSQKLVNGLEKLVPIPISFAKNNLSSKVVETKFEVITSYLSEILSTKPGSLTFSYHVLYEEESKPVAYSLYILPISIMEEYNVDLGSESKINNFIENLHKVVVRSQANLIMTKSGTFLKNVLGLELGTDVLLINEVYYDEKGREIASIRHTMLPDHFEFIITRS